MAKTLVEQCRRRNGRFECAECGRRVKTIYVPPNAAPDAWACRRCWNLGYTSQRLGDGLGDLIWTDPAKLQAAIIERAALLPLPDPTDLPREFLPDSEFLRYRIGRWQKHCRKIRNRFDQLSKAVARAEENARLMGK